MLKKITAIVCIVIGIAVIVLGIGIKPDFDDHAVSKNYYSYSAKDYDLPYAKFGADFYTDIYQGSDYIVDVTNDINKSIETVVNAQNGIYAATAANIDATDALIETVYEVSRIIVISIGLGILALGLVSFGKAFSAAKPLPVRPE